ncbi:agmatinase [Candidatus Woesearchaeota archaeon]|nr:agmatinase [Candidatus Woesearchaeota archaeon]
MAINQFGDFPPSSTDFKKAKVVIVPVPYDGTSTWIKGADKGPAALMYASGYMELYDIETDSEVHRQGVATDKPVTEARSPEAMVTAVEQCITSHLQQGKFCVVVGGEHSVSVGTIKAHATKYPDLAVLQLDAHTDLRQSYKGSQYNHACAMARAQEHCPVIQVGIRSMDASEKPYLKKGKVFFAENLDAQRKWIPQVLAQLPEQVYITIDLDVFDPSIMPSTGTPEPGGLFWYDVLALLKTVAKNRQIVGFDVVELCPNEHNKAPDFLAAKLIYKLLSYRFEGGKKQ